MRVVLWLVVAASLVHVGEEYVWPGGFLAFMRRVAPSFTTGVATPGFAMVINGLMVLGLVIAALVGPALPALALSGAAWCTCRSPLRRSRRSRWRAGSLPASRW